MVKSESSTVTIDVKQSALDKINDMNIENILREFNFEVRLYLTKMEFSTLEKAEEFINKLNKKSDGKFKMENLDQSNSENQNKCLKYYS